MTTTLANDARTLRNLRETEREQKTAYEETKAEREQIERSLIARLEVEETDSLRVDGVLFSPTKTAYGQIQDRELFVEWAQTHGDTELVEVRERKALLHELVREKLDNGEALPPGVGFYVKEYISQRAS